MAQLTSKLILASIMPKAIHSCPIPYNLMMDRKSSSYTLNFSSEECYLEKEHLTSKGKLMSLIPRTSCMLTCFSDKPKRPSSLLNPIRRIKSRGKYTKWNRPLTSSTMLESLKLARFKKQTSRPNSKPFRGYGMRVSKSVAKATPSSLGRMSIQFTNFNKINSSSHLTADIVWTSNI